MDLMVIPRSCSSARVSVARASPALPDEMIPALARRESVKVDLPWSTCAMTDMLRTFVGLSESESATDPEACACRPARTYPSIDGSHRS